jgi:hypothetical protein
LENFDLQVAPSGQPQTNHYPKYHQAAQFHFTPQSSANGADGALWQRQKHLKGPGQFQFPVIHAGSFTPWGGNQKPDSSGRPSFLETLPRTAPKTKLRTVLLRFSRTPSDHRYRSPVPFILIITCCFLSFISLAQTSSSRYPSQQQVLLYTLPTPSKP